jgi:hypothetical protein
MAALRYGFVACGCAMELCTVVCTVLYYVVWGAGGRSGAWVLGRWQPPMDMGRCRGAVGTMGRGLHDLEVDGSAAVIGATQHHR